MRLPIIFKFENLHSVHLKRYIQEIKTRNYCPSSDTTLLTQEDGKFGELVAPR